MTAWSHLGEPLGNGCKEGRAGADGGAAYVRVDRPRPLDCRCCRASPSATPRPAPRRASLGLACCQPHTRERDARTPRTSRPSFRVGRPRSGRSADGASPATAHAPGKQRHTAAPATAASLAICSGFSGDHRIHGPAVSVLRARLVRRGYVDNRSIVDQATSPHFSC